jgi:FAD dependent oxidoreductase
MTIETRYDVAVIGAGVFGAWTVWSLQQGGMHVVLLDASGAGNSRSSSGGESRIIRMGYGRDEIYTRWSTRALTLWQEFCERTGQQVFHRTGVLWMARTGDAYTLQTEAMFQRLGVRYAKLSPRELEERYPRTEDLWPVWRLWRPAWHSCRPVFPHGVGRNYRIRRRGAHCWRAFHPLCRLSCQWPDGLCLFHESLSAGILAHSKWRGVSGAVLLRLFVYGRSRVRTLVS